MKSSADLLVDPSNPSVDFRTSVMFTGLSIREREREKVNYYSKREREKEIKKKGKE